MLSCNNINKQVQLARNLYKLYGNKTVFRLDLEDLEKMVNASIISERQALFFWEVLLQDKVEKAKIQNMKYYNESRFDFKELRDCKGALCSSGCRYRQGY